MGTLILSPHADDEVLGCGGILANSNNAHVVYFGINTYHVVSAEERVKEVARVAKFLGFTYTILNFPVDEYQNVKVVSLINTIEAIINKRKPDRIYIPWHSYNQDHRTVREAALIALRPHDVNHFVSEVFSYETDQYKEWATNFVPNYFEQIDIEVKKQAYSLHASQVRNMRGCDQLEQWAAIAGRSAGFSFAEAFCVERYCVSSDYVEMMEAVRCE